MSVLFRFLLWLQRNSTIDSSWWLSICFQWSKRDTYFGLFITISWCILLQVSSFSAEVEARAVIEHQCLAKRVNAAQNGYMAVGGGGRIIATGGASVNKSLLQVRTSSLNLIILIQILADVFQTEVFVHSVTDSAALGCALRAKHGSSFDELKLMMMIFSCLPLIIFSIVSFICFECYRYDDISCNAVQGNCQSMRIVF